MSEWVGEHGLLFVTIGVLYLIIRDIINALLSKDKNGNGTTLLNQKLDHNIYLTERNGKKIDEMRDEIQMKGD